MNAHAQFAHQQGDVRVAFWKDPYTPEQLKKQGLNERQIQAVLYVKEKGSITNRESQTLVGISKRTASDDLTDLVQRGILIKIGGPARARNRL